MKTLQEIRTTFIDYFKDNGHTHVPSSPLIPQNDPTLMFTAAGMVQFKDVFTGKQQREYTRAVTSQKCLRAGGKHNDLENVGYTARHHTFFEMLGNFSFGDYFKDDAIHFSWELLTKNLGLPPEKLLITVYHDDDYAADVWKKVSGFSDDKIIRISTSDNFWSMGDTGPCGPCSEIFYDHGEHIAGGPPGSPDEDGDRFVEIWNLVFMQYDQPGDGTRVDLPKPSIDTGMGLERIAAVLQGTHNNYETDLFKSLIGASVELTKAGKAEQLNSHMVIADHLRACSFLIADGVLPSNEGRGYVLRRIMRRAMRHAHILGAKEPLMWQLFPTLQAQMGVAYPELTRAEALITETLRGEEEKFRETLSRGLKLLQDESASLTSGGQLAGDVAFKLYDTYGFPLDLTQDVLKAKGISVDEPGFNTAMQEQKDRARAAWVGSGDTKQEAIWLELQQQHGNTEFLGYNLTQAEGIVQALVQDGKAVNQVSEGEEFALIANQTPFYGESGGQMGDSGILMTDAGAKAQVTDTKKYADGLHVHMCKILAGTLEVGQAVQLTVDRNRRDELRKNHSATHLLHSALKKVLGEHVTQKGSLVAPDRLRFDFAHQKPVTEDQRIEIEQLVNKQIQLNLPTSTQMMSPEEAQKNGAIALFGERYGEVVRVVRFGENAETVSMELCGGTHVNRTGDIGLFKIIAEESVASGIRRIEALTGLGALQHILKQEQLLYDLAQSMKVPMNQLQPKVSSLLQERKALDREVGDLRRKLAMSGGNVGSGEGKVETIGDTSVICKVLDGLPAKEVRGLADDLKKQVKSGVVVVAGVDSGKVSMVVGVTNDLTSRLNAADLVAAGAAAMGGRGGGKPDLAQAGGTEPDKLDAAVTAVKNKIAQE